MKRRWWKACLALTFALLVGASPAGVSAHASGDVNDFVINGFEADYTLTNEDPQGTLKVRETIIVDFHANNHGLLRAIPDRYKNHSLQIQVGEIKRDGQVEPWSSYTENSNKVLKIGDPDKTVTGQHTYEINYALRNVITFYDGHDEFYWDINGDQWQQVAREVSVTLRLPDDLKLSGQQPICYTGTFGSTERSCDINYDLPEIFAQTTRPMQGYETLSIVAGFEKGYFQPSTGWETLGEYVSSIVKFLIPVLLLGGTAFIHWRRYGRDPKGKGVIVPHYEAPEGLKPIEAGTVADFRTDNRDITATIIDLAVRGYVKIIETTKDRKILKDIKTYSLRLEKTDFSGLDYSEKKLLKAIFSLEKQGEEVDLGSLKYKLSSTADDLRKHLKDGLVKRGYIRKTPLSTTMRFALLLALEVVAVIVLAVIFQGAAVMLGIFAGTALAVIFIILLPSRTPQGVAAREEFLGLKMYMEVAEKHRIEKLQSPDAPYATQSKEPKKTVELFEKLLPYAVVLGVEEKWAQKFEHIYQAQPDWYQGHGRAFSAVYLAGVLNSGVGTSVNAAFSSPSSSGSSGFSGGGSGGGGGGGGGGGW